MIKTSKKGRSLLARKADASASSIKKLVAISRLLPLYRGEKQIRVVNVSS